MDINNILPPAERFIRGRLRTYAYRGMSGYLFIPLPASNDEPDDDTRLSITMALDSLIAEVEDSDVRIKTPVHLDLSEFHILAHR